MGLAAGYVNSSTLTVSGSRVADFVPNRRVRANCGGDGQKEITISGSSFGGGLTTITFYQTELTNNLVDIRWSPHKPGTTGNIARHGHSVGESDGYPIASTTGVSDMPATRSGKGGQFLRSTAGEGAYELAEVVADLWTEVSGSGIYYNDGTSPGVSIGQNTFPYDVNITATVMQLIGKLRVTDGSNWTDLDGIKVQFSGDTGRIGSANDDDIIKLDSAGNLGTHSANIHFNGDQIVEADGHFYIDNQLTISDNINMSADKTVDGTDVSLFANLTAAEISQLENIGTVTITNAQWSYLGELDQSVKSTADVTFNTVTTASGMSMQDLYISLMEATSPGTPASGTGSLYVDATGDLHYIDDDGNDANLISAISGSQIHHDVLQGLDDDDHPQYSFTDGTRGITGTQDFEVNITVSGTVDGVDVATRDAILTTAEGDIDDLEAATGTSTGLAGLDYSTNNYVTDNTSLETAVGALDTQLKTTTDDLDGFPGELKNLTAAEIGELENIGAVTITNTQWSYLGSSDQALATTDDVTFDDIIGTTLSGIHQGDGSALTGLPTDLSNDGSPSLGGDLNTSDYSIIWDDVPSGDHDANGDIITMQVDENATGFGAALHMDTDGNWIEADASAMGTMPCTALALETGTGSKSVLLRGFVRDDSWSWTVGDFVYVSITTGGLSQTVVSGTGEVAQPVGFATHSDRFYFNPSYTLVELV